MVAIFLEKVIFAFVIESRATGFSENSDKKFNFT